MKKVTAFLEAYVQWVALVLAVLWLGYVGYAYWYQHRVAAKSNEQLTPGTVDQKIAEAAEPLVTQIKDPLSHVPPRPKTEKGDDYARVMGMGNVPEIPLANVFPPQPTNGPAGVETKQGEDVKASVPVLAGILKILGASHGMSVVVIPNPAGQAGAGNGVNVNGQTADCYWVSVSALWMQKAMLTAWENAKLPPIFQPTLFMHVTLVRQEWVGDKWVKETVIKELPVHAAVANGPAPAWPPQGDNEQKAYEDWVLTNIADVIEPPFYEVVAGIASDPWHTWSEAAAAPIVVTPGAPDIPFDPTNLATKPTTPEEVKARADYNKLKEKEDRQARMEKAKAQQGQPRTPAGEGGGGTTPRRGKSYMPLSVALAGEGAPARNFGEGGRGEGARRPNPATPTPFGQPAQPLQPGQVIPAQAPSKDLPTDPFTPGKLQQDIEIWAHDDTVVPGHTYRYMLKVTLKNPLFGSINVAKNQSDADKYTIEAQSEWTKPVSIPVNTHFFVTNNGGFTQVVQVMVISWAKGEWKPIPHKLSPGDPIPGTGCAVVDTRNDYFRDEKSVLVRDEKGKLVSRTVKGDQNDPTFLQLQALIKQQQQQPAAANANP